MAYTQLTFTNKSYIVSMHEGISHSWLVNTPDHLLIIPTM